MPFALVATLLGGPDPELEKQVLYTAVDEVRRAEAFYRKLLVARGRQLPFSWVVRQQRRHERRLLRVIANKGYDPPKTLWKEGDINVPDALVEACSAAVNHELRQAAIYEQGEQMVKGGRARGLFRRLARRTRYKHLPRFESCVRRN